MKKNVALGTLFLLLSINVASAQLAGGILCGLGAYCPPTSPPSPPSNFVTIKDSPMGSLVRDYFGVMEFSSFYNTMNHFFKYEVGHQLTWGTSGWGTSRGGVLKVLDLGSHNTTGDTCFLYKSELKAYNRDYKIVAYEDYIGAACPYKKKLNPGELYLFQEIDRKEVRWQRN